VAWISVGVKGLFLVEVLVVVGDETIGAAGLFEGMLHRGEEQRLQRGRGHNCRKRKKK
jgi:hypothetical protein